MNPGVWVMGGGGQGGGGSGGGGDGDAASQGGQGGTGGGSASGGSRSACGGRGSCVPTHPGHRGPVSRGDPVDVLTGRVFTVPASDLVLPGPLPLMIERSYSTALCEHDIGLGRGWTFSLGWYAEVRRRTIVVRTGAAAVLTFRAPKIGEVLAGPDGWLLRREQEGIELVRDDGLRYLLREPARNGYRLSTLTDRYGNAIVLTYRSGHLIEIIDSVGRKVRLPRTPEGRIAAIEGVSTPGGGEGVLFARYEYSREGDLVRVTDADGYVTSFAYQDHRLVQHIYPTGLVVHYRYDASGRCYETWGAPEGGVDPCLDPSLPPTLIDGRTRAKGIFHCHVEYGPDGYCEVVDSALLQRYSAGPGARLDKVVHNAGVITRTYDANGHVASFTDPEGATIRWERDMSGRPLRVTDTLGRTTVIDRDLDGHIRSFEDPSGARTEIARVGRRLIWRDPIGAVFEIDVDARGLTTETVAPSGARTKYRYDEHSNLIEKINARGEAHRFSYDFWGRLRAATDPSGATMQYHFTARGDLEALVDARGEVTRFTYDGLGNTTSVTYPDGLVVTYRYGGMGFLHQIHEAGRLRATYLYDREGRIAQIVDPLGARQSFAYDPRGLVIRERAFDGRTVAYTYDLAGRLTGIVDEARRRTELVYDTGGQLVARVYNDEIREEFAYDECGRLVEATSPAGRFEFRYNAVGWLVEERQTVAGETMKVTIDYDLMGFPIRRRTSSGGTTLWERDPLGRVTALVIDGQLRVEIDRDALGREVRRRLSGGGAIEQAYHPSGRLGLQRVLRPAAPKRGAPGEPDWIGRQPEGVTLIRAYHYDAAETPTVIEDSALGQARFTSDGLGQITGVWRERAGATMFRYDAAGNLLEGSARGASAYAAGNRLVRAGRFAVHSDEAGRVVETVESRDDGQRRFTRLNWRADGMLDSVDRPDGEQITFAYDPFARRVGKWVRSAEGSRSFTRYIWDGASLLEERTATPNGTKGRTYLVDEEMGRPLGHRDHGEAADWLFYVADDLGAPHHLVRGDGALAGSILRSPWGLVEATLGDATTPLGFRGQYTDAETGLSYNRYRYYDPALGRYLSPDPLGAYGGLNLYAYADNAPLVNVDPEGLLPRSVISQEGRPDIVGVSGQVPQRGDPNYDPAVGMAHYNARVALGGGPNQQAGNEGCAEIAALHGLARQIRQDDAQQRQQAGQRPRRMTRRQVREEMRRRFQNGARIRTNENSNGSGQAMCPCRMCAQTFRELGIHPQNIGEGAVGGVVAPNPGRRNNGGLWDGQSIWRNNRNEATTRAENNPDQGTVGATFPSRTPPFQGT